eukprot:353017-Chlamydomonas_euryale.AAC.2
MCRGSQGSIPQRSLLRRRSQRTSAAGAADAVRVAAAGGVAVVAAVAASTQAATLAAAATAAAAARSGLPPVDALGCRRPCRRAFTASTSSRLHSTSPLPPSPPRKSCLWRPKRAPLLAHWCRESASADESAGDPTSFACCCRRCVTVPASATSSYSSSGALAPRALSAAEPPSLDTAPTPAM